MPGPGNYTTRDRSTGPSFKIGGKYTSKENDLPGPGTYDGNISSAREKTKACKIG